MKNNSNINKNIFRPIPFNFLDLYNSIKNTPTQIEEVKQKNHNLSVNDFIYKDLDDKYKKAIAENSNKSNVSGIVYKVINKDKFIIMNSGIINLKIEKNQDTSIIYLSDKISGKACNYQEIENTIYVPLGIRINENEIVLNIQQGSIGEKMAKYEKEKQYFEKYDKIDIEDIINKIKERLK